MTDVIRSADVAEKAISVRLDAEAQRSLEWIMGHGYSQSEAIREALIRAARSEERAQTQADAKRIANDPIDRAEIAAIQEFFGELDLPPG
jgi:Arc/MetJ-type ribon-helix-helix transcriptional regulator